VAALAETPDEQSDVAAPQGSETEPEAQAVPDEVEDALETEIASAAELDVDEKGKPQDDEPAATVEDAESAVEESDDEPAATEPETAEPKKSVEPEPAEPRELAVVGRKLGGRYRLERLVRSFGGGFQPEPQLWVGVDELLNRRVGVDLIATEHPLIEQVARAARDAAAVADARFVQVLDAVQEEDLLYIVTEWVPGAEQLQERLAEGPLSPARATQMVRELAEAMVRAHEAEVAHGAMNPATVMITAAGEVKLRGLLVEATLSGAEPESAEPEDRYAADVLALGQIWYASLTARWPGTEAGYGLEAAPADGAALYTPAQIRAAVPKPVDATVCRALGLGDEDSFSTIKELADAIRSLPRMREEVLEPTTALPPRSRSGRPAGTATPPGEPQRPQDAATWSPAAEPARKPVWRRRGVLAIAACAVVALGTLAAFQFSGNDKNNGQSTEGSVTNPTLRPSSGGTVNIPVGTKGQTLTIAKDTVWDSDPSSGSLESAANAFNNSSSGWTMTTQQDSNWATLAGGGIGLVFDLGSAHTVDEAKFQIADAGATVEILTAPAGASTTWTSSGLAADGFTLQKTLSNVSAGSTVTASFTPVSAEYIAIIFTQLQQQGAITSTGTPAGYRDTLLDVSVLGE